MLLACTTTLWTARAQAADQLLDIPRLMDAGEYQRALALLRPEIANPRLPEGETLSDIRELAIMALGHLTGGQVADAATDAEVAALYAGAVRYAGTDEDRKHQARAVTRAYYENTDRPGRTLPLLLEDLAYDKQHGDRFTQVTTLTALVSAFSSAGLSSQSDQYRREALKLMESIFTAKPVPTPPPQFWNTVETMLLNAASEAADSGDGARAAKFGPGILAINDRFLSPRFYGYFALAELYAFAGDDQRAQRIFAEGRKIFAAERPGIDPAKSLLADIALACAQSTVELSKSGPAASRRMDACLDGFRRAGIKPSFGTRLQAARIYERTGAADKALENYQAGIEALGTLRGSYTVAERVSFMNLSVARKLYWGRLRMLVQKARATQGAGATAGEDAFRRAFAAADEYRARQLGEVVGGNDATELPDLAAFLSTQPPGTLLLGLTVMDDRTVVMAVDGPTRRIVEVPVGRAELEREVRGLLDLLSNPGSSIDTLDRALQAYSAHLLGDVRPMLRGRDRVIVALDGPTALIPPALLQPADATDTPLGLAADVSATPAFRLLARLRAVTPGTQLMALGDPAYPDSLRVVDVSAGTTRGSAPGGRLRSLADGGVAVPPLPETRDEVVSIGRLFPAPSRLLLGTEATKSAVQRAALANVGFLHFATHGLLPGDIPGLDEPALVLAPDSGGDALLRSSEAEKLDLRAVELTVLSACNTGSGQAYAGEGVMGLSRAFLAAGSRAVIVSMWPVASRQTETLMVEFYRLRQSGLPLEQALRQASVRASVARQGWGLVAEQSDIASGKDDGRPGSQAGLTQSRPLGSDHPPRVHAVAAAGGWVLCPRRTCRVAGDLMMRVYAAMAQKERELISERTRAALAAARVRGAVLGGDRGYRPSTPPSAAAAAMSRTQRADQAAHRLLLEIDRLRNEGVSTMVGLARALTEQGVPTPREGRVWTHTTVARLMARLGG